MKEDSGLVWATYVLEVDLEGLADAPSVGGTRRREKTWLPVSGWWDHLPRWGLTDGHLLRVEVIFFRTNLCAILWPVSLIQWEVWAWNQDRRKKIQGREQEGMYAFIWAIHLFTRCILDTNNVPDLLLGFDCQNSYCHGISILLGGTWGICTQK